MKSSNKFKQKHRYHNDKWNVPTEYYFDQDSRDTDTTGLIATLYYKAESLERQRTFGLSALSPEGQLDVLQKEIKVRVRITKNEIFKIGELLIYAKKICQQEGKKFQEWISNNLDFSYETANNFMNVYKQCLGVRKIAMNLSPSILYQISAPGFPDKLKKYLFDTEQLNEITNGKLREITRKYKEGGFDAIKDDIEELNRGHLIYRQSHYTLDLVENALRTLEALKEKIETRGRKHRSVVPFDVQIKADEPEAFEVNSKLVSALQSVIDLLDKARHESEGILFNMKERLHEKCGVGESDDQIKRRKEAATGIKLKKVWDNKM